MKHIPKVRAVELAIADVIESHGGLEMEFESEDDGSIYAHAVNIDRDQLERIADAAIEAAERWDRQHRGENGHVCRTNGAAENAELQPAAEHGAAESG